MSAKVWSFNAIILQINGGNINEFGEDGSIKLEPIVQDKITVKTLADGNHHMSFIASKGLFVTIKFAQMSDSYTYVKNLSEAILNDIEFSSNTQRPLIMYFNAPQTQTIGEAVTLIPMNDPEEEFGKDPGELELKFIAYNGRDQIRNHGIDRKNPTFTAANLRLP